MKNLNLLVWSITVALGGFLFGFDTAVISGAEQKIQKVWELNAFQHGFTISIALIGTVIGALLGGIPSDILGRRKTLFWIAIFYLISALGSALAFDWYVFLGFRFLGGLGVGASSVAAPLYIAEISPASKRGKLVAMFQFNIVFGIVVAYISNYYLEGIGSNDWRWMLGVEVFPALIFTTLILFVPRSPRWLVVKQNNIEEARKVLDLIDPASTEQEIIDIQTNLNLETNKENYSTKIFSKRYKFPIILAVLFAVFNQVSGINAIIYFAPRIFQMAGLGASSALLSTIGIGVINFISTLIGLQLIDRIGRRTLMLIGSIGLIITLALVAKAFYLQEFGGFNVPIYLFLYISFFAFSQGAVIWVFISEIFPNSVRAQGQALGSFTHWLMAAVIAFVFPYISEKLGGGHTFMIFSLMMVGQLVFVLTIMPETKGKTLEEIEKRVTV
ncbi:MAG: sugar porter family MFS transporter [Flammeovirgaceae bacterium]|nr:sugar porter family MFS transporter [Flammeovirgaceae bacterium]